jgi:hypothetical protein
MTMAIGTIWRDAILLVRDDPVIVAAAMAVSTVPAVLADIYLTEFEALRAVSLLSLVLLLVQIIAIDRSLRSKNAVYGRDGGRASFYPRAFGQTILSGLAVISGLLFLILPGLFIALRWSISLPVLISGNKGVIESLSESWRMTKGHELRLFAVFASAQLLALAAIVFEVLFLDELGLVWFVISETAISAGLIMCWYLQIAVFLALRESDEIGS